MNRRGFFRTAAAAFGWAVAPKPVKALAPVESGTTEWVPLGSWVMSPKPMTIVYRCPTGSNKWIFVGMWPEMGAKEVFDDIGRDTKDATFMTGFDPETGCMDMLPPAISVDGKYFP